MGGLYKDINGKRDYNYKEYGNGLGLNIARATIQDHGGKINLTRLEGKGTEVRVYLPIYKNL